MAAICSVEGCLRPASVKGWCQRHYYALRETPECSIEGCDRASYKRGWCNQHYQRWRRHGDPNILLERQITHCSVEGCTRSAHGQGLCSMHHQRLRRTGSTEPKKRIAMPDHARCSACKRVKKKSQFSPNPSNPSGVASYCKPCAAQRERERRQAKPDEAKQQSRRYALKKHGLTPEQFDAMLDEQGGVCAICKGIANGKGGVFHVDHDHETNRVRGILCHSCNVALGHFADDPKRLRAALRYLEKGKK